MIGTPLFPAEDGLKPLCVKIAVVHHMASLGQCRHYPAMKRGLKAVLDGMCIHDEKPHRLPLSKALLYMNFINN